MTPCEIYPPGPFAATGRVYRCGAWRIRVTWSAECGAMYTARVETPDGAAYVMQHRVLRCLLDAVLAAYGPLQTACGDNLPPALVDALVGRGTP